MAFSIRLDEYDTAVGDRAYKRYLDSGEKTYTMEEMLEILELE